MTISTFEEIRYAIAALGRPAGDMDRATYWLLERLVGIAKTTSGRIEIFLVGSVRASFPSVRRHLEHGAWQGADQEAFLASRIVLPEGAHFEPIAAVIAVELLRVGQIDKPGGLQKAFEAVEPIIDMTLRNISLSDDSVLGLLGEMLTLEQLLISARHGKLPASNVVGAWRGFERGARDFVLGNVAIEVKATRAHSSRHRVSSLGQIEPRQLGNGLLEKLWLLSIGLAPTEGGGQSVTGVADRLTALLSAEEDKPLRDILFQNIARYGCGLEAGFQYDSMRAWPVFVQQFEVSFTPRLYDLQDPDVKLLRTVDLAGTHVDPNEVEYAFTLPERVNDRNPERGWQRMLVSLLQDEQLEK